MSLEFLSIPAGWRCYPLDEDGRPAWASPQELPARGGWCVEEYGPPLIVSDRFGENWAISPEAGFPRVTELEFRDGDASAVRGY